MPKPAKAVIEVGVKINITIIDALKARFYPWWIARSTGKAVAAYNKQLWGLPEELRTALVEDYATRSVDKIFPQAGPSSVAEMLFGKR